MSKMATVVRLETLRHPAYPKLLLLRLHDDHGHVGLGETSYGATEVASFLHEQVAPYLLGQDAGQIERHWSAIWRLGRRAGSRATELRALSAIDMALWDLLARRLDQPLYQLAGGLSRDRIRVYNTCAGSSYGVSQRAPTDPARVDYRDAGRYEDQHRFLTDPAGLAADLLAEGYTAMKIWPFDRFAAATGGQAITPDEVEAGVEPFRRIREALGERMEVALEMHALWSLPAAVRIARAVAPYQPMWVEDPIPADQADALADLRRAITVPVCASETLSTRWAFQPLLERGALDVCMLDVSWVGGVSEARRVASLAEVHHRPVTLHDCVGPLTLAASVHLSLSLPNALIQETVRAFTAGWYREVVTELPPIRDGYAYPPEGPGLGTELQPALLEHASVVRQTSDA